MLKLPEREAGVVIPCSEGPVQIYTYLFLDPRDVVQGFEFDECRDDVEAQRRARDRLRRQPERRAVEVWTETSRIAVLA
jgi:hypothetical protein